MSDIEGKTVPALRRGEKVGMDLNLYGGRVMPETFGQVVEFAQMMCKGGVAVPKHLRDQPGACLRVIQQSMAWEMDPWGVASKSYAVNEQLAFEAQLIIAVIKKWAPVKEKVWKPVYEGEGADLKCTITVHHAESGEEITYTSPIIGKSLGTEVKDPGPNYVGIWPKNSPLWRSEPSQQLYYYSMRAMARRYFPEILLGVYDRDEVLAMRDVTPKAEVQNFLNDAEEVEHVEGEVMEPNHGQNPAATIAAVRATFVNKEDPNENQKVADDVAKFGIGIATINDDGKKVHVPMSEIFPDPPVAPEIIKANLLKYIAYESDAVKLQEWQNEHTAEINDLPFAFAAEVRDALTKRHADLDQL